MGATDQRVQVPANCELTLGMVCVDKSRPGHTIWEMVADERFANPVGTMQGGFLTAFLDSAMGSATVTWAKERRVFSANVEIKVSFLKPAKAGELLRCAADVIGGGSRVAFAEATVLDSGEQVVARASSTYLLTPRQ